MNSGERVIAVIEVKITSSKNHCRTSGFYQKEKHLMTICCQTDIQPGLNVIYLFSWGLLCVFQYVRCTLILSLTKRKHIYMHLYVYAYYHNKLCYISKKNMKLS